VIVLTSSNQQSDIHRANLLGASGFVVKPGDPQELLAIVSRIKDYWLSDRQPEGTFTDFAAAANIFLPKPI
jgi:DNA-binding NarL/FixJ family response regulator